MPSRRRTIKSYRRILSNKLNILSAITYVAVCIWLLSVNEGQTPITVCPSKLIYHIPCAGCGTTRATLLLLKGQFFDAISLNPNCILALMFICLYPIIGVYSLLSKQSYITDCYNFLSRALENKYVLVFVLICEIMIWIHNIIYHI